MITVRIFHRLTGGDADLVRVTDHEKLFNKLDLGAIPLDGDPHIRVVWSSDDCVVLDIDHLSMSQWKDILADAPEGYAWTAWATRGYYGSGHVNVHVVVPMTRPVIDPDEYSTIWINLNADFGSRADPATKAPGRRWFRPSRPEGFPPVAWHSVGAPTFDPNTLENTMTPDLDFESDQPLTWDQVLADPRFSEVKRRQRGASQNQAQSDHFTCHFDGREFVAPDLDTILFGVNRYLRT